jgi:chorismate mutase
MTVQATDVSSRLRELRDSVDNIDAAIVHMLAERFRVTNVIGELKARHRLPPQDCQREAQQVSRLRQLAVSSGLDPDTAEKFLSFVVREVVRLHEAIPRGSPGSTE